MRCRCLLLGGLLLVSSARADLNQGLEAANRQNWNQARIEFETLAGQGHPAAMVNLGNLYMRGLGVVQDYQQAMNWYQRAASQGDRAGESKLGLLYYYGLGVSVDYGEAAQWFERSARQGETGAATILASLYARGEGVDRDLAKAYFWYTRAMEQGSDSAEQARTELVEEMSPGEMGEALSQLAALGLQADMEKPKADAALSWSGKRQRNPVATGKPGQRGKKRHKVLAKQQKTGRHATHHRPLTHRGHRRH